MSYTSTPNIGLRKPIVGADADAWGGDINFSMDTLDSTIHGLGAGPFLPIAGGTLNGALHLNDPTAAPNQIFMTPVNPSVANTPQGYQFSSFMVSQTTGGNFSDMYCNIRADTSIQGGGSTGITGILSQMTYNGYGGAGGYVPFYGQFSRRTMNAGGAASNPQIWGAVFEVIDWTNTDSAQTNHMSGIELDMTCGNTDSANSRRAFGIYLNKANASDAAPVLGTGIHVAANVGSYNTAIKVETPFNVAALDLRSAPAVSGVAHTIWLATGGTIAVDTGADITLSGDGTGLFVNALSGNPARTVYTIGGVQQYWSGAWADGNFYLTGPGGSAITLTPAGGMTLGGALTLHADPAASLQPVTLQYFNAHAVTGGPYLPTAGGAITGTLSVAGDVTIGAASPNNVALHCGGAGNLQLVSAVGQPAYVTFKPGSLAGWWSGAWGDGSFYIAINGGGNPVVITPDSNVHLANSIGVNGATPPGKPTVTGACAGNTAIKALLTALASYGLVTDSTSA